mgnify:CR=1 FL=1
MRPLHNLQVMLAKLKMSYTDIRDAILKMDISTITMEGVALFAQWCPSDQEATMIRDFIATQCTSRMYSSVLADGVVLCSGAAGGGATAAGRCGAVRAR